MFKVKLVASLQMFSPFTKIQTARPYYSNLYLLEIYMKYIAYVGFLKQCELHISALDQALSISQLDNMLL